MARIRTIKPEFWTDEKIVELDAWARLLFIGLWNFADDEGRMVCSEKRIKMQIFPGDSPNIRGGLDELARAGLIDIYVVDDIEYLQIPTFLKHQRVDHPSKSKIPQKPKDSPRVRRTLAPEGNGREGKGEETTPATSRDSQADSGQPAAGVVPESQPPTPELVATVEALRTTAGVGTDDHARAGELFAVLKANSCRGTPAHPTVVEWARQGIRPSELRAAIVEARKSNTGELNPAYLDKILERLKSAAPTNGKAAAWATDDGATEAKARELGLWPARPGESYHDLRGRIRAKIEQAASEGVR